MTTATKPAFSLSRPQILSLGVLVAVYVVIGHLLPRPTGVQPEGWRLLGLFVATILGLILQPIPGAALVLIAITLSVVIGAIPVASALGGYADPSVWLVVAAFMISRALIACGLARRIALFFVWLVGRNSIGLCYSLAFSDLVLAAMIPSNGARSGGVILPIARSICEVYNSRPGPTASRIGIFMMLGVYQSICVTTSMFLTGQASNPITARMAGELGYPISWGSWLAAGIVPGLCSLLLIPFVVGLLNPPELRRTPEASGFAAEQLRQMGRMSPAEWMVATVFVGVCAAWVTTGIHGVDITVTAMIGCCVLLLTGILPWSDVTSDVGLWDMFVWYGGLVRLGKALGEANITQVFAQSVAGTFVEAGWIPLFVVALLVYFYTHYGLASITAHILAMYTPFVAVLIAKGAPIGLVAMAFAIYVNFSAGLTHYGTTPSPMYFAQGYVSMKDWWKTGFVVSLVNLAVWSTVGFSWWKLIGVW